MMPDNIEDLIIISRKEAKEQNLTHYYTNKVCKNGGLSLRRVDNGLCICDNCKAQKREVQRNKNRERYNTDEEYRLIRVTRCKEIRKNQKEKSAEWAKKYREKEGNEVANTRARNWYNQKPKEERAEYSLLKYYKNLRNQMYSNAKGRAKKQSIPFTITKEDIIIPDLCPVFNIRLEWGIGLGKTDNSPSLDRIIPEKGYIKGNIVVISWLANRLKNNATLAQLEQVCNYIRSYAAMPKKACSGL
jgi:hypothetical protein